MTTDQLIHKYMNENTTTDYIPEVNIIGKIDRMLGNFMKKGKEEKENKKIEDNWKQIMDEYGDLISFASKRDKKHRFKVMNKIIDRTLKPKDSKEYMYIHDKNMGKLANWYFTGKLEGDIY